MWGAVCSHRNCKWGGRGGVGAGRGGELKLEKKTDPGDELVNERKNQKQYLKCSPPDPCFSKSVLFSWQETYLEYLFMPGRFTNAAIQKALQVSEGAFMWCSLCSASAYSQFLCELGTPGWHRFACGSLWTCQESLKQVSGCCAVLQPACTGSGRQNLASSSCCPWRAQQVAELAACCFSQVNRGARPSVALFLRICLLSSGTSGTEGRCKVTQWCLFRKTRKAKLLLLFQFLCAATL